MPSASAALYRRAMLDQTGGFDADFFLYCEDTDLGLRAARLGWTCLYASDAIVDHRYSHSAGRVSPLKAYYVERNRLAVAIKNFPAPMLLLAAPRRCCATSGTWSRCSAARAALPNFIAKASGAWRLAWFVFKAHMTLSRACLTSGNSAAQISASSPHFSDRAFLGAAAPLFHLRPEGSRNSSDLPPRFHRTGLGRKAAGLGSRV